MTEEKVKQILDVMQEVVDDPVVPKNVKSKINSAMQVLKQDDEISIKINKALDELDEIGDDNNLEPYTRSQIWNIVSALEMV
ncbi:hypothetical protein HN695_01820 [Candidatus Woesearchaeota archaeon]|jgi:uncharacterized protein|nr:hypothetical protein [Candidatus Woesearchaeota archaeon]MBT5273136.1 hypothetical protein [Candidatus Woesearchaeota archaeon]MBT6337549.1 hypothetical protein [Candidatus Woesearchaeota archaeon]MBT7927050.1 hypothetical protein [Candidatus Woesearchaeota archaeon]